MTILIRSVPPRPVNIVIGLVVLPPRWVRLFAMLLAVAGVAALFLLGSRPFAGSLFLHPVDKLVHVIAFGGLAAVMWVMLGGKDKLADYGTVIFAGIIGTTDETIQRLIPTRQASLADLIFDIVGICIAVALLVSLRSWYCNARAGNTTTR